MKDIEALKCTTKSTCKKKRSVRPNPPVLHYLEEKKKRTINTFRRPAPSQSVENNSQEEDPALTVSINLS